MKPAWHAITAPATAQIRRWVLGAFPRGHSGIDYDDPAADPGLFGPDSVTWRIHADFPGMLSGGMCALMLQTLHPQALAGVWDHSNFRQDLVGRLRRTTNFVAGTTYAPTSQAVQLIERVARIHTRVRGTTAGGVPYAADDPGLLTWVHVTEAYGFIEGYRRYCSPSLPQWVVDRYYDESRLVAERLGAREVPASQAQVDQYFASQRAGLVLDERSREVMAVLSRIRLPVPAAGASRELFLGAGAALLPPWARSMLRPRPLQQLPDGAAARTLAAVAPLFRAALPDGVAARACQRMDRSPGILQQWPERDIAIRTPGAG